MTQTVKELANHQPATPKPNCDILLNNFQIKKKRYRVLLNNDHIVWERFDGKQTKCDAEKLQKKETELEREQLSNGAIYGAQSKVVHMNEVVRVAKGITKSSTFRIKPQTTSTYNGSAAEQQHHITIPPTEQYLTLFYVEQIVKSPTDCNRWRMRSLTLYNSDAYIVQQWYVLITKILENSKRLRVRRLLVFINPYGGRKQGMQVYERFCKPIFQLADIDASCIISQRANQILDILMTHDLSPFDAVCCVGGDGTVAEVINGLIFRTIRDLGLDSMHPEYIPKPRLPIAIIPAGSTDTVAYSLHGTADVRTAAIHLILGQRRGLDICSVRNQQGIVRFCTSVFSYGYLGDVASKSEKYRWMGTKRYEYTGVKSFLLNRGYEAEIRMLMQNSIDEQPSDVEQQSAASNTTSNTTSSADTVCYANCQRCSSAVTLHQSQQSLLNKSIFSDTDEDVDDDDLPTSSNISLNAQRSEQDNTVYIRKSYSNNEPIQSDNKNLNKADCDKDTTNIGIVEENQINDDKQFCDRRNIQTVDILKNVTETKARNVVPQNTGRISQASFLFNSNSSSSANQNVNEGGNWKTIKGNFFMICGTNINCACTRSPNGISRYCHLGDGHMDLVLVRKTSLLNNIRFVVNTMGRNGDIRNLPFVDVYRIKKFSFRTPCSDNNESIHGSCQPIADSFPNVSCWNCDGEVVNDLDITMSSHCQLIDVFMRGPSTYVKPIKSDFTSKICCCIPKN